MKFNGSIAELTAIVDSTNFKGVWSEDGSGKHSFRAKTGAILSWWSSTGTVQIQGDKSDSAKMKAAMELAFSSGVAPSIPEVAAKTRIFVVHGHDVTAREQLELVLHRLGVDPFVLMNSSGGGMTIIEALERHIGKNGQSDIGIVLMTPDDMGYSKKVATTDAQPRARQNVILEMGMLLASLTRSRCVILVKGHLELPSDAHGIIYLHFNDHVKEVVPKLAERLQASGITITAEQISKASM